MLRTYGWVAAGGALGSMARLWLTLAMLRLTGPAFPWGTLLINAGGSFVIGWFGALTGPGGRLDAGSELRAFVLIGLCGGFTTFSSFSVQTFDLLHHGHPARAVAYATGSVLLCLLAVWAGLSAGRL